MRDPLPAKLMHLILFFHLAAAIFWMGGMAFMVLALRAPVAQQLQPPVRLPLLGAILARFFVVVGISIAVLLATGVYLLMRAPAAPAGWHAMAGIGVLMMLIFGHIFFGPFRRLKQAIAAADWPEGGRRMGQITLLAKINLGLGWLAIAAVMLWR
ncbi:MAG TPA: CopD family protein [Ramlibacter sp.]|nr:CopD family protein [Ramlibacter sp.]